jgi:guanine deaminase
MEENVQETEEFVKQVKQKNNPLITPVITPRFVPTCSAPLMQQLGEVIKK